jgi:DNA polymerase III epsilon subunit-like protein
MPQWSARPLRTAALVFFDLETTGLRPDRGARICEMAVVDRRGVQFDWVSESGPPSDAAVARRLPELIEHLQDGIVVGHNLSFDVHFLTYEAERLGLGGIDVWFTDTLGLARRLWPDRDDHRLGQLLTMVDAAPAGELHTAVGDARATRALFWHLVGAGGWETLGDVEVRRLRWHGG